MRSKRIHEFLLVIAALVSVQLVCTHKPTPYVFPQLKHFPEMPKSPDNVVTVEGAELGRYLFYDEALSVDRSLSCASCHQQVSAFADAGNAKSIGANHELTDRNGPPLFNLAWYEKFGWDGSGSSIEDQAARPLTSHREMNISWSEVVTRLADSEFYRRKFFNAFGKTKMDSTLVVKALGQFLRTLISHNSKYDRVLRGEEYFTEQEFRGFMLANDQTKGNCLHCHVTDSHALGTNSGFSNNGLDQEFDDLGLGAATGKQTDNGKFKVPSLRNLGFTAPYMHDGRFETLSQVLDHYDFGIKRSATLDSKIFLNVNGNHRIEANEKEDLLAFLNTLNDAEFVLKEEFADPLPRMTP